MGKFSLNLGGGRSKAASRSVEKKNEQRNWYKDRYQSVTVQRNILALVTTVSLVGVLLSSLAISQLTPLKSVEPFVIQVEDKTGVTQVVNPVQAKELTADEAVNRYFIVKYIVARESYDPVTLSTTSDTVRVMSSAPMYYEFRGNVDPTNPSSWYNKYLMGGTRQVSIKSISFLSSSNSSDGKSIAQARIQVIENGARGDEIRHNQIVTLTFQYAKLELTTDERYINPLGFQVVGYRVDDEVNTQ